LLILRLAGSLSLKSPVRQKKFALNVTFSADFDQKYFNAVKKKYFKSLLEVRKQKG